MRPKNRAKAVQKYAQNQFKAWPKSDKIKGQRSMQRKLVNHELYYNYMKHMRAHQTSQI